MPVANKIEVQDLTTALTAVGADITIGASYAATDDALMAIFKFLDAVQQAQAAQNNFAGAGEDVQAVTIANAANITIEYPPSSGTNYTVTPRVYQVSGNVVTEVSQTIPNLV